MLKLLIDLDLFPLMYYIILFLKSFKMSSLSLPFKFVLSFPFHMVRACVHVCACMFSSQNLAPVFYCEAARYFRIVSII